MLELNNDLNSGDMHLGSKSGKPTFNLWWLIGRRISKLGKFLLWSWIWPWRSRSSGLQSIRALNQCLLHLWSKYSDRSLNGWRVIVRTSQWFPHRRTGGRTDGHTDIIRQRQYPKAQSGLGKKWNISRNKANAETVLGKSIYVSCSRRQIALVVYFRSWIRTCEKWNLAPNAVRKGPDVKKTQKTQPAVDFGSLSTQHKKNKLLSAFKRS